MTIKSFDQIPLTPEMRARANARSYCARAFNDWLTKGVSFTASALRQCHGQTELTETRRMLGLMGA